MVVADAPPAGLAAAPVSLMTVAASQHMSIGYGTGGAMVQGSAKTDREIAKLTFEGVSREEVSWRVCQNWKLPKSSEFAVKKERWEAVMQAVQASWPRLGFLEGAGSCDSRFVFSVWVEDGAHEDYSLHHVALVQSCRLSMAAFVAARKKAKSQAKAKAPNGNRQDVAGPEGSLERPAPRQLCGASGAASVQPRPSASGDFMRVEASGAGSSSSGVAHAAGQAQACVAQRVQPSMSVQPVVAHAAAQPSDPWPARVVLPNEAQAPVQMVSGFASGGDPAAAFAAAVRPTSAARFWDGEVHGAVASNQLVGPQQAPPSPGRIGTRKRITIRTLQSTTGSSEAGVGAPAYLQRTPSEPLQSPMPGGKRPMV